MASKVHPEADEALDAAQEGAGDIAAAVQEGAGDIADAAMPLWEDADLDEAYTTTMEGASEIADLLTGAAGGFCSEYLPDLGLVEIWRDFYQLVALFFINMKTTSFQGIAKIWGSLGAIAALDLSFLVPDFPLSTWLIIVFVLALIVGTVGACVICDTFKLMPDDNKDGLETKTWADLKKERPKMLKCIQATLFIMMSVHLPISRMSLQLIVCKDSDEMIQKMKIALKVTECPASAQFAGGAALVLMGLGVPFVLYRLISTARPVGSPKDPDKCFDKDGITLIDFTDEIYHRRVVQDRDQICSPLTSLYKDFERRWAWYKVIVMLLKMVLAFVIILADKLIIQAIASIVILAFYTACTMYATPYINSSKDKTEIGGKLTNLINLGIGALDIKVGRLITMAIMGINKVFMLVCWLSSTKFLRHKLADVFQKFTFSDTYLSKEGNANDIVNTWDLEIETKHRIWWPFWDGILMKKCGEETGKRLVELKRITENEGLQRIIAHFADEDDYSKMGIRREAIEKLEGVDCFDERKDDFAKMYIKRYPFECVVVPDNEGEVAFLDSNEKIATLCEKNREEDVEARRQVRWELRALVGETVHRDFDQMVSKTVEDGTETYQDGEETKTRTRYSTIQVHMFYHNGKVEVGANTDKRMAAGFKMAIAYSDGHGEGVAPHTGEVKRFTNEHATISASRLGFTGTWRREGPLAEFLEEHKDLAEQSMGKVTNDEESYRKEMKALYDQDEAQLPSSFWFYIYNDTSKTREQYEEYFAEQADVCKIIARLPQDHKQGMNYVMARLVVARKSARTAFWYVFFDDLWQMNKNMSCMKKEGVAEALDPQRRTAICYRVHPRDALEKRLQAIGIRHEKKLFSDELMDLLYATLESKPQ